MIKLMEGLKPGDLVDLVLPLITVDEYESKIDDTNIVVGFYVMDKDPANDLCRFIERGEIETLDCDVSPAPNKDGYYLVFVEFIRNKEFPKQLDLLLKSLENLTSIEKWQFKAYKKGLEYFSPELIAKNVPLKVKTKECVVSPSFLRDSMFQRIEIKENTLTLDNRRFEMVAWGSWETILTQLTENKNNLRLDESSAIKSNRLNYQFGANWQVDMYGDLYVCSKALSDNVLVIKEI